MTNKLLILVLLLIFSQSIFSQQPFYRQFTEGNGLPSSEVYHALQDSKGFIWFATNNGVSRYNGTEFENFGLEDGLPDLTVFEIYEDYKGRIWFIPMSGQLSYFENDTIYKYQYNNLILGYGEPTEGPIKNGFFIDEDETVFLSIDKRGLLEIDKSGNISETNINNGTSITQLELINDSVEMLVRGYINSKKITEYCWIKPIDYHISSGGQIGKPNSGSSKSISIKIDSGYLISVFENLVYVKKNGSVESIKLPDVILSLYVDSNNILWVGSLKTGIFKIDLNKGLTIVESFFSEETITSVLQDSENGFWYTTYSNGVFYCPSLRIKSILYKNEENIYNAIEVNSNGVFGVLKNSSSFIHCGVGKVPFCKKVTLPSKSFIQTCYSADDTLYLGSPDGFHIIDYVNGIKNFFIASGVLSISKEKEKLILARSVGITIWEKGKEVYTSASLIGGLFFNYRVNAVYSINDTIYLGALNGLWHYRDSIYTYLGDRNPLLKNRVLDIKASANKKILFLATKGAGLIIYSEDTTYQINALSGLSSNYVTSIEVSGNTIWAATNKGLNKIEFFDNSFRNFEIRQISERNGLSSNIINDMHIYDSTLYLATNNGICYFATDQLGLNETPPPIYIENISINSNDTLLLKRYKLRHDMNMLSISYRGLTYRCKGDVKYRYRLVGIHKNWVETYRNELLFNALEPGKYLFQVQAANEDNVWSEQAAEISIAILPPFWKTWWFLVLSIFMLLSIAFLIIRARFKAQSVKNELNTDLIKIRQQALGSQMNPHFIFNSLNSIQNYILQNDRITSQKYLSSFATLMRKVLSNSQSHSISLEQELSALDLYIELEKIRFSGKFEFSFEVDQSIDLKTIRIPPLMLQPYVENAIWHGLMPLQKVGQLKVVIKSVKNQVMCIIEDNGIGRKKAKELKQKKIKTYDSMGMSISDRRINLFNMLYKTNMQVNYFDIENENGEAQGTRVEFQLPLFEE